MAVPQDVREVYSMLKSIRYDLTDTMMVEVDEWMEEVRGAAKQEAKLGTESSDGDWEGFREWMNEICRDDGMPRLFVDD